jgi:ring-1,2-phenylacetyl-CoA epoxidase subunit PaaE
LLVRPDVPYGCTNGMCGTCRAKLVRGEVEMDHCYALADADLAAGFVLTCQAQPRSEQVVLDYDA